jgi:hypothetical protein
MTNKSIGDISARGAFKGAFAKKIKKYNFCACNSFFFVLKNKVSGD